MLRGQWAGVPDPSFGNGGMVCTDVNGFSDGYRAIEELADGRILLAGYASAATSEQAVIRAYYPDGSLDTGFSLQTASLPLPPGMDIQAEDLLLLPGGDALVALHMANGANGSLILVRVDASGVRRTSFAGAGLLPITKAGASLSDVRLAQGPGNTILVAANVQQLGPASIMLSRFFEDGTPDRSFGTDGTRLLTYSGAGIQQTALATSHTGLIYVSGEVLTNPSSAAFILSLDVNGNIRSTFGASGWFTPPASLGQVAIADLQLTSGGAPVFTGYADQNGIRRMIAGRLSADGSPDLSFGNQGWYFAEAGQGIAWGTGLAETPEGGWVVTGGAYNGTNSDILVAWLDADGAPDTRIPGDGLVTLDLNGSNDRADALYVRADGKVLLAGATETTNGYDLSLVRLLGPDQSTGFNAPEEDALQLRASGSGIWIASSLRGNALVTDMGGRTLSNLSLNGDAVHVDLPRSGVYLVTLIHQKEKYSARVLIP